MKRFIAKIRYTFDADFEIQANDEQEVEEIVKNKIKTFQGATLCYSIQIRHKTIHPMQYVLRNIIDVTTLADK